MSTTDVPADVPAQVPAQVPTRRRGAGTVADMLRSLVVCGGFVAVVVLLFFTSGPSGQPPRADVSGATAQARAAGLAVSAPHVPSGWSATSARYAPDTTEGLPTWHVGYLTASKTDASVDVTRGATPAWIAGAVGADSDPVGYRTLDGVRWQTRTVQVDGSTVRSLERTVGERTELVSGHASWGQLSALARGLNERRAG